MATSDPEQTPTATLSYPPPPFLRGLGKPDSVRTPLGHYRTESLFLEQWRPMDGTRPAYTLMRDDREDPKVPGSILPSFQKAYINLGDPTGYQAAIQLLGSWRHWQKLIKAPWFKAHLDMWNEEIIASLKYKGLSTFTKAADKGDLKAAEWLINYTPEGPPPKAGRGRPTRADINKAARDVADSERNAREDAARLGLGG